MAVDNAVDQTLVATEAKKCFVISPFDERGHFFYENYVEPACALSGFSPERADQQLNRDVAKGIATSLGVSPMVIAYLGSFPYNQNVVFELGYRLATRMPYVIVCDEPEPGKGLRLPFHIEHTRIVQIPRDDTINEEQRAAKVNEIMRMIRKYFTESVRFSCNQALAVLHAPLGPLDGKKAIYVASTPRATKLFGIDNQLVGRSLAMFVADRKKDMPDYQFEAFFYEQAGLTVKASPEGPPVIATTPIVFSRADENDRETIFGHDQKKHRAYLPIIVNYQEIGDIQEITVLYMDVTSVIKLAKHTILNKHYYVSTLNPVGPPIQDFHEPIRAASTDCTDGVFLAHNSSDKDRVRPIYQLLKQHNGSPWFDEACIRPGANWLKEIESGLENCRSAFVFVGKNGYGPFQEKHEVQQLFFDMLQNELPLVPILMDDVQEPPRLLRGYQAVRYEEACSSEWIEKYVRGELPTREMGFRSTKPR